MIKSLTILLTLLASVAVAEPMSRTDNAWEIAYQAMQVIDWSQTRTIAQHPDRFLEYNPLIGRHPSIGRVDTWMATGMVSHYVVSRSLNRRWRRTFQIYTTVAEIAVVGNNRRVGIWLSFPLR